MLEMMNAGLLQVDRRRRLEGEDVGAGAARSSRSTTISCCGRPRQRGWAIRKDSPKLAAALTEFYVERA